MEYVLESTTDKLNYLAETKEEIADAITEKGVYVTDDVPFRKYAELIDSIIIPTSQEKYITRNGVFTAPENVGYAPVTVDMPNDPKTKGTIEAWTTEKMEPGDTLYFEKSVSPWLEFELSGGGRYLWLSPNGKYVFTSEDNGVYYYPLLEELNMTISYSDIAKEETEYSSKAYEIDDFIVYDNEVYVAINEIKKDDKFVIDDNIENAEFENFYIEESPISSRDYTVDDLIYYNGYILQPKDDIFVGDIFNFTDRFDINERIILFGKPGSLYSSFQHNNYGVVGFNVSNENMRVFVIELNEHRIKYNVATDFCSFLSTDYIYGRYICTGEIHNNSVRRINLGTGNIESVSIQPANEGLRFVGRVAWENENIFYVTGITYQQEMYTEYDADGTPILKLRPLVVHSDTLGKYLPRSSGESVHSSSIDVYSYDRNIFKFDFVGGHGENIFPFPGSTNGLRYAFFNKFLSGFQSRLGYLVYSNGCLITMGYSMIRYDAHTDYWGYVEPDYNSANISRFAYDGTFNTDRTCVLYDGNILQLFSTFKENEYGDVDMNAEEGNDVLLPYYELHPFRRDFYLMDVPRDLFFRIDNYDIYAIDTNINNDYPGYLCYFVNLMHDFVPNPDDPLLPWKEEYYLEIDNRPYRPTVVWKYNTNFSTIKNYNKVLYDKYNLGFFGQKYSADGFNIDDELAFMMRDLFCVYKKKGETYYRVTESDLLENYKKDDYYILISRGPSEECRVFNNRYSFSKYFSSYCKYIGDNAYLVKKAYSTIRDREGNKKLGIMTDERNVIGYSHNFSLLFDINKE